MKKLLISVLVIAALLASACISDKDATTEEPTDNISQIDTAPLIPREVLFGNPDKITARLSPDGTQISYLAPVDGVLNVWVGPADDPEAAGPVTNDTDRGIRIYFWAYTGKHILYLQDQAGDENWRVYSVNPGVGEITDLTPLEGVQARIQAVSQKFPGEILIALNDRDPTLHDIHRVNITTGKRSLVMENEGFLGFTTDDDYNVRFAERLTPDGGNEIFQATEDGSWELFMEIATDDLLTTGIVGFDKTGTILYMIDSRNRNTAAFFAMDLETYERTLIAEDSRADTSDIMIHPTEKIVQAVAFTYERKHWQIIDESIAGDLDYLNTVADGDVEVVSRTLDDRYWMVAYEMDDGPVLYYRYDREERGAEFLFTHRKALAGLVLAKMHPVVIKSRDGLDMVSYYTLPIGSDRDSDGRPDEPLSLVLFVHGGPWARDNWGYNSVHQWLANRGYAVLSVNFRGSTGFGKEFANAGNLEWGGKMHDDLIDAVNWAVQEGIADPDRVAIMGGSYGGYATLWGITNTSDTFACGVDIVGPSNLITLFETVPPYWQPVIELFATRMGDARTEDGRAFLAGRSPLSYVDRIEKPLLIGQGANDPRVKQAESDQIVHAMQDADIPVTYLLYTDEGHGFVRPENRLSFYAVTDAFLAEHLGGRYEPIGDDLKGSSIIVQCGAEEVPGLAEVVAGKAQHIAYTFPSVR
jgi:dipeptidyl aminopeptidase/acylaminoacyl peptidase